MIYRNAESSTACNFSGDFTFTPTDGTMNDNGRACHSCRTALSAAAFAAVIGLGLPLGFAGGANADEPKPMLMFVQTSDDLKIDPTAETLRLVKVGQQTLYFADRPERIAGHVKMGD